MWILNKFSLNVLVIFFVGCVRKMDKWRRTEPITQLPEVTETLNNKKPSSKVSQAFKQTSVK